MRIGYHVAESKFMKKSTPWYWKALDSLAYVGVHKKLKDHLGLPGYGIPIPEERPWAQTISILPCIGVNLKQIYGQTEIAGISVLHRDDDIKFDTVGRPIPETEVKITPEGEIISKAPPFLLVTIRCRKRRPKR